MNDDEPNWLEMATDGAVEFWQNVRILAYLCGPPLLAYALLCWAVRR